MLRSLKSLFSLPISVGPQSNEDGLDWQIDATPHHVDPDAGDRACLHLQNVGFRPNIYAAGNPAVVLCL